MGEGSKSFLKNVGVYFMPFVLMAVIAIAFLNRTFSMLEVQNASLMRVQLAQFIDRVEGGLLQCSTTANAICVDSVISEKNMKDYGISALNVIRRLGVYGEGLDLKPNVFVSFGEEDIVTAEGSNSSNTFMKRILVLDEISSTEFESCMKSSERFQSAVLEDKNGKHMLLLVYYFPESIHIEEKKVGFIIRENVIDDILAQFIGNLNGKGLIEWNGKELVWKDYSESVEEIGDEIDDRQQVRDKALSGYAYVEGKSDYYDLNLYVAIDNRIYRGELRWEEIKMIIIGVLSFLILSAVQWWYANYRYKILAELKSFAVSKYPEIVEQEKGDCALIRRVLERDFERLQKQDEDIERFRKESLKQLKWLLLNSSVPQELEIVDLLETYGLSVMAPYYCVTEIKLKGHWDFDCDELTKLYSWIVICDKISVDDEQILIIVTALKNKDDDHKERIELIQQIAADMEKRGFECKRIVCGLVYEELTEVNSSYEEANSLISIEKKSEYQKSNIIEFFDEGASISKYIPNITNDLLLQFTESLKQQECDKALKLLSKLLAPPRSMAEDLLVYTRYKVIQAMMEAMHNREEIQQNFTFLMSTLELDDVQFESEVQRLILQMKKVNKVNKVSVEEIAQYIVCNSSDTEMSLTKVSEAFGLHERVISRMLKNAYGKNYKDYLNEIRLGKACELLKNTDLEIQVIVRQVGYYDLSSFNRLFKQFYERTPREYRNIMRGGSI